MSSIRSGERSLPKNNLDARAKARRAGRPTIWSRLVVGAVAVLSLGVFASGASADGSVTLPGGPLQVSVGSLGECQSSYTNVGTNYFPPEGTVGDCGFFLAFPSASANPTPLKGGGEGTVFGFQGSAGPHVPGDGKGGQEYTAIEQGPVTGSGTPSSPYTEVTTYKVTYESKDYALITATTTYVSGEAQFTSTYAVQNITGTGGSAAPSATLYFHAIEAGDLYVSDNDHGTGVFLGGPPRFIGGQNAQIGTLGGFIEASPAWSNWQEGWWDEGSSAYEPVSSEDTGIWYSVRESAKSGPVFNDSIEPLLLDNAAGVSWDNHLESGSGLAAGETATYSIVNRSQVPTGLSVQPVSQAHTVGQTASITVTATDSGGAPYGNRSLVYSIGGSNPKTGSVTTNSSGVATISYVGTVAGLDTIQMFLDLAGNGVQEPLDPASAAQVTWAPLPPAPTPNSTYTVQSIKANSNGTITIVFVPAQGGKGEVVVTVPTGTIARNEAIAARKAKKCKKNQIKLKGKCQPKITTSGKVSATGVAGVPLTLTVKPSGKVTSALKKGKTVHLTATLTYTSALGGVPTVQTFHVTVKGKRKGHKKH
jgi:hypothetical protein